MGHQLYRRLPQAFVVETLEAFNDHRMTERQACALLGLKRARLYELRREWLRQRATWALNLRRRLPLLARGECGLVPSRLLQPRIEILTAEFVRVRDRSLRHLPR